MSNLKEAADEARKLVKMLRSVEVIADTFDSIANVESLTAEINQRLAKAQELEAMEVAKREAIKIEADEVVKSARDNAEAITKEAKNSVHLAKNQEAKVKESIKGLMDDINHIKSQKESAIDDARAQLVKIEEQIATRNKDLYDIESKIVQAKEQVKQMLGG